MFYSHGSAFENYDKVINFSLYVNKVEIDKILLKFVGWKLHPCIIHAEPNYMKSFQSLPDHGGELRGWGGNRFKEGQGCNKGIMIGRVPTSYFAP